jgi:thiamine kinase-like enzyme
VNIQQQSGLTNQIDYEFGVLKYLERYQIAPKVYHSDNTKSAFDFDILIEEYLEGPWVTLQEQDLPAVAALLVKLHSLDASQVNLITWSDPLMDTLVLVRMDLEEYRSKKSADPGVVSKAEKLITKLEPFLFEKRALFTPDSINHTDVAIDNFVKTSQGLKLIDWEKPRFDDCSYDVCCFLAEPAQLWCIPQVLSAEGREKFLQEYITLSGRDKDHFLEKVRVRQPLVSLHWIFWGMNRLCDLRDQKTASELQGVHSERLERWERVADPHLIKKIYEMI